MNEWPVVGPLQSHLHDGIWVVAAVAVVDQNAPFLSAPINVLFCRKRPIAPVEADDPGSP